MYFLMRDLTSLQIRKRGVRRRRSRKEEQEWDVVHILLDLLDPEVRSDSPSSISSFWEREGSEGGSKEARRETRNFYLFLSWLVVEFCMRWRKDLGRERMSGVSIVTSLVLWELSSRRLAASSSTWYIMLESVTAILASLLSFYF